MKNDSNTRKGKGPDKYDRVQMLIEVRTLDDAVEVFEQMKDYGMLGEDVRLWEADSLDMKGSRAFRVIANREPHYREVKRTSKVEVS